MHAVQLAHVPLFAKISIGVPEVFQALTRYLTVVPPGWPGITAVTTSTVCGVPLERSWNVQRYAAVRVCVVPEATPNPPAGVLPSVVKYTRDWSVNPWNSTLARTVAGCPGPGASGDA